MARHINPADLPQVTDAHRRAAFTLMGWPGCSFDDAMADTLRRRVIEACAHQLRTREWLQQRRRVAPMFAGLQQALHQARYLPHVGAQERHATTPWPPAVRDLKRAAAGDLDD